MSSDHTTSVPPTQTLCQPTGTDSTAHLGNLPGPRRIPGDHVTAPPAPPANDVADVVQLTYYDPGQLPSDAPSARRPRAVRLSAWADLETFLRDHEVMGEKGAAGYIVPSRVLSEGTRKDVDCAPEYILYADYEPPAGEAVWDSWPCEFVAHTTASHLRVGEKNPNGDERWHVFMRLASPLSVDKRKSVRESLAVLCPACAIIRNPSQPAFMPTRPTNTAPSVDYVSGGASLGGLRWQELPVVTAEYTGVELATERNVDASKEPDTDAIMALVADVVALWPANNRHPASLALGGVLYGSQWRDETCELFAECILDQSGSDVKDGMKCVSDTFVTAERGDPVKGIHKFRGLLTHGRDFQSDDERFMYWGGLTPARRAELLPRLEASGRIVDAIRGPAPANDTTVDATATAPIATAPTADEPAALAPAALAPAALAPTAKPFFRVMSWDEIMAPLGEVEWLCKGLDMARTGRPIMIGGKAGRGKTWAVQALAMAVATGTLAFGHFPVRQGKVVHIDLDQGEFMSRLRYQQLAAGLPVGSPKANLSFARTPNMLDSKVAYAALLEICDGCVFAFIDCLRNMSAEDENSSAFAAPLRVLEQITEATGCKFAVLHHTGKGDDDGDNIDILRGTSGIGGAVSTTLLVSRKEGMPSRVRHLRGSGFQVNPRPFLLHLDCERQDDPSCPAKLVWSEDTAGDGNGPRGAAETADWLRRCERVVEIVKGRPGCSKRHLEREMGGKLTDVRKVIDAVADGEDSACGERVYRYGASKGHLYFPVPADQLILDALAAEPKIEVTLVRETQLPKGVVVDTLRHLVAKGEIHSVVVMGESGWQRRG